jgi:hypothetical protein
MSGTATQQREGRNRGWREIRHYAYVDRPYEDVWPVLAGAPRQVLSGDATVPGDLEAPELHVRRAGITLARTVRLRFGGIVVDEERARLSLRWEDSRHPKLFPVLEAVLDLAPVAARRRQITQIGLVGRYLPPLGVVGGIGDRLAGEDVAAQSVARFVDELARRLERMVTSTSPDPEPAREADLPDDGSPNAADQGGTRQLQHVLLTVERLEDRPGGAAAVHRYLATLPGMVHAEVDPYSAMAEIEYDPERCCPGQIMMDLEEDRLPGEPRTTEG